MTGLTPLWSHEIELEATAVSSAESRAFVCQCLVEHRLLYLVDPVRLAAGELATNALVHDQPAFTVKLSQPEETVQLAVRDKTEAVPLHGVDRVMDTHGRGLHIVGLVSSEWGTNCDEDGIKSVWASFPLRQGRTF